MNLFIISDMRLFIRSLSAPDLHPTETVLGLLQFSFRLISLRVGSTRVTAMYHTEWGEPYHPLTVCFVTTKPSTVPFGTFMLLSINRNSWLNIANAEMVIATLVSPFAPPFTFPFPYKNLVVVFILVRATSFTPLSSPLAWVRWIVNRRNVHWGASMWWSWGRSWGRPR